MSLAQRFIAEFEEQAPLTRKYLERLPKDKLLWKPHEKSLTAGQLAMHLASVPSAIARLVQKNPGDAPNLGRPMPQPGTIEEILKAHDEGSAAVRAELAKLDDAAMHEMWRLTQGEREILSCPRAKFVRDIMLSHWYQHRGQFAVYLRMLDVSVPATWGPSADEPPVFMQKAGKS